MIPFINCSWEITKCGGKLVSERTRTPSTSWMTELSFADDDAIVTSTREIFLKLF